MSRLMLCNLANTSTGGNDTNNNANTNSSMEDDDSYPLPTIYRCRAPIASLDCMEEFNGGGGGAETGVHCSNTAGTKEQLLTSCIAAQAQRLQHPSPGIRYRNLGKSGLRVSNVGLGKTAMTVLFFFYFPFIFSCLFYLSFFNLVFIILFLSFFYFISFDYLKATFWFMNLHRTCQILQTNVIFINIIVSFLFFLMHMSIVFLITYHVL
ncbi:hypothetical protein M0802_016642 [Mischocyttarus mexicanus]|nr:hypothetical protein M0802_016642 [Mischocyttarus mexicanus]